MSAQKYKRETFDNDESCIVEESFNSGRSYEPSVRFARAGACCKWLGVLSLLERLLLCALVVALVIIITLAACLGNKHHEVQHLKSDGLCPVATFVYVKFSVTLPGTCTRDVTRYVHVHVHV